MLKVKSVVGVLAAPQPMYSMVNKGGRMSTMIIIGEWGKLSLSCF